ncbi:hypothetical protein CPB83DRAFT_817170 [Crepidotus variabilis]|uniref:Uncharacterized protein n=1 Tax=Crepidotus variabilis TaxID=179855 RepID=A0A9P6JN80_9AGAR|nr:hypothetical protein CPB83DRAFT_817170 [Crepidotus variabilis]
METTKKTKVPLVVAYYCSGHGYGHATRVSAFTKLLLTCYSETKPERTPLVYIVSSAPEHVFSDSLKLGAKYRFAEVDPVIVQPVAYHVDRVKSVEVLRRFLKRKEELLEQEHRWLVQIHARCVLSDAAFLGCLAARAAKIPSVIITNFTFDSVYSYLSTNLHDLSATSSELQTAVCTAFPDASVSSEDLEPLVSQILEGYCCAGLLVRLPGFIPIPSFLAEPSLPSFRWVDPRTGRFTDEIKSSLVAPENMQAILPPLEQLQHQIKRSMIQAPLIVRHPSPSIFTAAGRALLLDTIGIPPHKQDPKKTKILIVSFGGQVFKKPRSPASTPPRSSRSSSRSSGRKSSIQTYSRSTAPSPSSTSSSKVSTNSTAATSELDLLFTPECMSLAPPRLATPGHIYVPGAPPSVKPFSDENDPFAPRVNQEALLVNGDPSIYEVQGPFLTASPCNSVEVILDQDINVEVFDGLLEDVPQLLPDDDWIAVICGVSKEQYTACKDEEDVLPDNFYVAPKDIYMPDLTVVADVLLGKLGYGTVSECIDACTPFVYVSRPLFIEEHGLRLLLSQEGTGVELSREGYEAGDWATAVEKAYLWGRDAKAEKLKAASQEIHTEDNWVDNTASKGPMATRVQEGKRLARQVLEWVDDWHSCSEPST